MPRLRRLLNLMCWFFVGLCAILSASGVIRVLNGDVEQGVGEIMGYGLLVVVLYYGAILRLRRE